MDAFRPTKIVEVELTQQLPDLADAVEADGYTRALVTALVHSIAVGQVEMDLADRPIPREVFATCLWAELKDPIRAHFAADGLDVPDALGQEGLASSALPECRRRRVDFLAADPPSVDVIIPTRERPEQLERCLRSILATEYPVDRRRVYVVDSAPETDATRTLVEDRFSKGVVYLREQTPGSSAARNTGVAESTAPIVAFTDDDVVVDSWWLEEIARTYEELPQAGAVTGLLLPMELETPAQAWFEEYGGFSRGFETRIFNLTDHRVESPLYPFNAGQFGTGNSMSFRRDVLSDIGGFDPALGNGTPARGGVDTEVLLRTILEGHTIVYQPTALARHAHRREYAALRNQLNNYGVGLTATFTKVLLTRPSAIPLFLRRLPAGLMFALDPRSTKNARKERTYPAELTKAELYGMAYGPIAYLRSRRHLRRLGTRE